MTTRTIATSSRSWIRPACSGVARFGLACLVLASTAAAPAPAAEPGDAAFPVHPASVDELRSMEAHVVALVREKLVPATVGVQGSSGVIISEDGVVACAAHTVGRLGIGGEATVTTSDGREHSATVLALFPAQDTAILRIAGEGPFMHAEPLQDDGDVTPGSWVLHVGYPAGYAAAGVPGYVRLGRVVERAKKGEVGTVFLDDVGVAGGDSGGPVFDLQGRLIGVAAMGGRGPRGGSQFNAIAPIVTAPDWEQVLAGEAEQQPPAARRRPLIMRPGAKGPPDLPIPDRCLDVLEAVAPQPAKSVVVVAGPGGVRRLGAVCSTDGMIVTKGGDWAPGTSVTCVLHDGQERTAAVVATEPRYDLALVVVEATDLVPIAWAEPGTPAVGQWVVAPGPNRAAIAAGTVGALDVAGTAHPTPPPRTMELGGAVMKVGSPERQGTGKRTYPALVWHTAWLDAAELGGPLVDLDGRALGIAIERPSHLTGYMVPAAVIRELLKKHAAPAAPADAPTPARPADARGTP